MIDEKYIKRAIELGREGLLADKGGPFGAVIVRDDIIIGVGQNSVTSTNDPTAHAEINAIKNACKNLNDYQLTGATIYTSCEPCPMCLGAIYWARIGRVVFATTRYDASEIAGFDDDYFHREVNAPWSEKEISFKQMAKDEGLILFHEWKSKSDKRIY